MDQRGECLNNEELYNRLKFFAIKNINETNENWALLCALVSITGSGILVFLNTFTSVVYVIAGWAFLICGIMWVRERERYEKEYAKQIVDKWGELDQYGRRIEVR